MHYIRSALVAGLIIFVLLRYSQALPAPLGRGSSPPERPAAPEHPFPDVINWDDESQRKEFEKHLYLAGFSVRSLRVEHPHTDKRWAKSTEFLLWEKGGTLVGFGAVFHDLMLSGTAVGPEGDKVIFKLNRAEIIYDIAGRKIFLITYRTWMSRLHKILWFFLSEDTKEKYRKKYRMGAERSIFDWGDLGEGYTLDRRSREYAWFLLNAPVIFKTVFDKEGLSSRAVLLVPFDHELFDKLSPRT